MVDQLREQLGVFVFEMDLRRDALWGIADVIDHGQSGDELGAGEGRQDRVGRRGDQNQEWRAFSFQCSEAFRVGGDHGVEKSAHNRGAGLGDAGGLGRIDDLRSSVQGSISARKRGTEPHYCPKAGMVPYGDATTEQVQCC